MFFSYELDRGKTTGRAGERVLISKGASRIFIPKQPDSRYNGFFMRCRQSDKIIKIVESIGSGTDNIGFEIFDNGAKRISRRNEETFIPENAGFIYLLERAEEFSLFLDVREPYDNSEEGRNYSVRESDKGVVFEFSNPHNIHLFVSLASNGAIETMSKWVRREYSYDKARGSYPWERYVFLACKIRGKEAAVAVSMDEQEAISLSKKYLRKHVSLKPIRSNKKELPLKLAEKSLLSLVKIDKEKGLLAGLPWFFQEWTRDEAVALKALSLIEKDKSAPHGLTFGIVRRLLESIQPDGMLPNIIGGREKNSDAVFWLFLRLDEMEREGLLPKKAAAIISGYRHKIVDKLMKHHLKNNLIFSEAHKSWMDSLSREGFPIELQAGMLMLLAQSAEEKEEYMSNLNNLKEEIKRRFFDGRILVDCLNCREGSRTETRPNIFLAFLLYPELLSKEEWERCFDAALSELWLGWGGLSTVSVHSDKFVRRYSGENPASYHNGDSWFWVNNYAALGMIRLNPSKYENQIKKIFGASSKDILSLNCLGCASELSSAEELRGEGCWNQAWSNASFIELYKEMEKRGLLSQYFHKP